MNEEAIKALRALGRQALPGLVFNAVVGAIEELELENLTESERQKTLCQSNGMSLTMMPSLYQCKWCNGTWRCHNDPPWCPVRGAAEIAGESPKYQYGGLSYASDDNCGQRWAD